MRRLTRLVLVTALAVAAEAAGDPWEAETDTEMLLTRVMTLGKGEVFIDMAQKQSPSANDPSRVDVPLTKEESDELARCRDLVAKGEHDAVDKAVEALVAKNPANWDAFLVRASSLHARKLDADALAALRTALIGNRRHPRAWPLLDEVAKALGKKVARPTIDLRGWVREPKPGAIEVGWVDADKVSDPWSQYAAARAVYRWGGDFAKDFPDRKAYVFTFREQMFAMHALASSAADEKKGGAKLSADLVRVLAEKKAGSLAPFAWFAAYPEVLTATPEKDFELLRPRLEKYFDEKIVVKR